MEEMEIRKEAHDVFPWANSTQTGLSMFFYARFRLATGVALCTVM